MKKIKKSILVFLYKKLPWVHRLGVDFYYRCILDVRFMDVDDFLESKASTINFFVQIGANDGITNDHIHSLIKKHLWTGILVEPLRDLYDSLQENYENLDGLIFENVAIVENPGMVKMFRHDPSSGGNKDQVSSLLKNHVEKFEFGDVGIIEQEVPGISFMDLLSKHKVNDCDLLCIDTEGYDITILETIPLEQVSIDNIIFEHTHVQSSREYRVMIKKLKNLGYAVYRSDDDTIATKPGR